MGKVVEAAADRVRQIAAAAKEENENLDAKIGKANERITKLERKLAEAVPVMDEAAYQKAHAQLQTERTTIEICRKRQKQLEGPLIDSQEYENMIAGIMAELTQETARAKAKLFELLQGVKEVVDGISASVETGNNALSDLQHKAWRDADAQRDKQGRIIYSRDRKFTDFAIMEFWRGVEGSGQYAGFRKAAEEIGK